jgi:DNA polymerase-1
MTIRKSQAEKRLVLIDGHAILHRAYHALPPLTTPAGEVVNAVYGFTTMLLKVINDLKPKYLIVAFDTPKPTFRHTEFVGYQAQRPKMEAELAGQIENVRRILRAMGIPIFAVEGFEADDVIGTLAKQAVQNKEHRTKNIEVIVVTGDRDLFQLIGPRVKIYAPVRGMSETQVFDSKRVKKTMGIEPGQIVDYKGLVGDPSDNYPGVPGVGPKTASQLLEKYKNIDRIYKNLDKLPEVQARKLTEGVEMAELSRKLAKIVTDAPVKLDLKKAQFVLTDREKEEAIKEFKTLGFRSLVERFGGEKLATRKARLPAGKAGKGKRPKVKTSKEDSQQTLF